MSSDACRIGSHVDAEDPRTSLRLSHHTLPDSHKVYSRATRTAKTLHRRGTLTEPSKFCMTTDPREGPLPDSGDRTPLQTGVPEISEDTTKVTRWLKPFVDERHKRPRSGVRSGQPRLSPGAGWRDRKEDPRVSGRLVTGAYTTVVPPLPRKRRDTNTKKTVVVSVPQAVSLTYQG